MEKSRSRHTAGNNPLIIDRPDLQTWPQRAIFGTLTTVFWLAWFALWLPLVTLIGWVAFGWQFKVHMLDLGGLDGFTSLLLTYAVVIAAMSGSLIAWAAYNYLRFRGADRRRHSGSVSLQALAASAGQDVETVQAWHAMRVMVAEHDGEGRIIRVTAKGGDAPAAARDAREAPAAVTA